jgi:hypothetical protein
MMRFLIRIMPMHISCTASVMEILEFHRCNTSVSIKKGSNQIDVLATIHGSIQAKGPYLRQWTHISD